MNLPRLLRFVLLFAVLGAAPGCRAQGPHLPAGSKALPDLLYVSGGHARQTLDLFLPEKPAGCPLIVWIHGGGWEAGSKEACPALGALQQGCAVASLNYRLSQDAPFPAQIQDCKAALRWLRAHAAEYGYDPARIGVWGASAGGHLVALLGVTGQTRDFDVGENLDQSSGVQCVVDWFGPTDFLRLADANLAKSRDPQWVLSRLFGGAIEQKRELANRASPVTWVAQDAAPTLIIHGSNDPIVPLEQSQEFAEKLKAAGVEVTLDVLDGAGHGGAQFTTPEKLMALKSFFERHLRLPR